LRKIHYRPLALALACLLAPSEYVLASDIPLDIIQEPFNDSGSQYGYRLGINVGVNGAAPKEYLFDTGSDSFNIDVGLTALKGNGPAWFPTQAGTAIGKRQFYLYGDGTYGYLQAGTTVSSIQFYNAGSGANVANFDTAQGAPVAINYAYVTTSATGPVAGTLSDGTTLKVDEQFQQNLANGVAPEEGHFYGIMGAGDFGNGVPGMLTQSGYVVEANGGTGVPGGCGNACLIVGLTPAIRAQFLSVVGWDGGAQGKFALSGAPSANQFDTQFKYVLSSNGQTLWSATYPTLFDTGTPNIVLIDNDDGYNGQYYIDPGTTLTTTGASAGSKPTSVAAGNYNDGDYSNVVTIGTYGGFQDGTIYGISFFFHNAVMYDLANQATGYTPFFVVDSPITTGFTVTPAMGPLGLAGTISGTGPFAVATGGVANLSGANTYTGATTIAKGGWLGLAGPGSIAASAGVQADGMFDISRSAGPALVQSLSGAGDVALGANTLELTNASGSFGGQLGDGGLGGGTGGSLIIASGVETLTGTSTYTGNTGIAPQAGLNLNGSLAGSVLNAGMLTGHGQIGGDLRVTGTVAPGNSAASYQTLSIGGNYVQGAGSTYLAQLNPLQAGVASLVSVKGSATLDAGAAVGVLATPPGQLFSKGARYTVLSADQGLTGTYTLSGNTNLSAVLGLDAAYDAQHVYLDVVQTRALNAIAGTRNQTAALTGVQSLPTSNALFTVVTNLPNDGQVRAAADQLSGDMHASVQNVFLDDSRYVRDAVTGRLRQGTRDGNAEGPAVQVQSNGLAWWGQFVGSWSHADGDGNAAALSSTVGGLLLGADAPVAVGDSGRLGMAAGYTQTSFNVDQRNATGSSHDGTLSAYAGTRFGAFGLSLGAAYTQHLSNTSRNIALPGFTDHAAGNGKAYTSQLFGEAGYLFQFKSSTLEPFAQGAYVRLNTDGFAEHGGAAALDVSGSSRAVTYTTLGMHAATGFPFGGDVFTAHATLGWRHAFGDVDAATRLAFAAGSPVTVAGLPLARNALAVDAGLDLPVGKNASFSLSYSGQIAHRTVDSGFRDSFIWRF